MWEARKGIFPSILRLTLNGNIDARCSSERVLLPVLAAEIYYNQEKTAATQVLRLYQHTVAETNLLLSFG